MRRFQSVESKVKESLSQAGDATSLAQRKLTKAEQMKINMRA